MHTVKNYDVPVLFLLFNRPEATARAFETLRTLRPRKLFLAADGPRPDRPGEQALCEAARQAASKIDWNCEVKRLFRSRNLGCGMAVSSAITWFFQHVEEGVILEDDLQASPSFFEFCKAMLARYREDHRVMHVGGNNFLLDADEAKRRSFFFSRYNYIWGWATWRRAWKHYDFTMKDFPRFSRKNAIADILAHEPARKYWTDMFKRMHKGEIDTWDYQWTFTVWNQGGVAVLPARNLVVNRGFDASATHTVKHSRLDRMPLETLQPPYESPETPQRLDTSADAFSYEYIFTGLVNRPAELLQGLADLAAVGRQSMAAEVARRFVRLYDDHPDFLYVTSLLLMQSGCFSEAMPHLGAYLKLRPGDEKARTMLVEAREAVHAAAKPGAHQAPEA